MESLRSLAAWGIGALGLIGVVTGVLVAMDFHEWAGRLHTAAEVHAPGWPNWIRRDAWGRSALAIRLYGSGLAFASLSLFASAFPGAGGGVGQYVFVGAFVGFAGTCLAAGLSGLRSAWRSPHRRGYFAVWNFAVYALEFTIVGFSSHFQRSLSLSCTNSACRRRCASIRSRCRS